MAYVIRAAGVAAIEVLVDLELEEAREAEDRNLDPAAVRAAVVTRGTGCSMRMAMRSVRSR